MSHAMWLRYLIALGVFVGLTRESPSREIDFGPAAKVLEAGVADKAYPGGVACVGNHERVLWTGTAGYLDDAHSAKVAADTIYDLASLTKIVGTTSVAFALIRDGKLKLDDPVEKHVPGFVADVPDEQRADRRRVTIEHLLTHSSGLPAAPKVPADAKGYAAIAAATWRTPLAAPPGTKTVYTDAGYILLGEVVSRVGGKPLAELERELIFTPLGLKETQRNPPMTLWPRVAPTERIGKTDKFVHGVVHDERARAADGLTGHAGLFAPVGDLARYCAEWLKALRGESKVFPQDLAKKFITRRNLIPGSTRALGWDTPIERNSLAGEKISRKAFGHTGFTGTTIWIDPERDLYIILLTNRVHPTRANQKIGATRRQLNDAVIAAFDAAKE